MEPYWPNNGHGVTFKGLLLKHWYVTKLSQKWQVSFLTLRGLEPYRPYIGHWVVFKGELNGPNKFIANILIKWQKLLDVAQEKGRALNPNPNVSFCLPCFKILNVLSFFI